MEAAVQLRAGESELFFSDARRLLAIDPRTERLRVLTELTDEEDGVRVSDLRVRDDHVYWIDAKRVGSVPIGGGDIKVHATVEGRSEWLVVTDDELYWMERESGGAQDPTEATVRGVSLEDGSERTLLEGYLSSGAAVVHDGRLYLTTSRTDDYDGSLVSVAVD